MSALWSTEARGGGEIEKNEKNVKNVKMKKMKKKI